MHHALEIDEILLNIFAHCNPPRFKNYRHGRPFGVGVDLVALASTCRTFKEPALDVLWSELSDLCPLAQCLPQVTYQITPGFNWYSFKRPLEQAEWNTLRSYTRRVRSVLDFGSAFHPDCVRTFLSPCTPEPLFPNLRYLRCIFANDVTPLLHQPLPSLTCLDYSFILEGSLLQFKGSLGSFPGSSLDMRKLSIRVHQPEPIFDKLVSDFVCRWSDPQTVSCPQISLDMNALAHLSRVQGLTQLSFAPSATLPVVQSDPLLFSTLHELKLFSVSLAPIAKLLDHIRVPAVTDFTIDISGCPSKQNITSFLTVLQLCGASDAITSLRLTQIHHSPAALRSYPLVLTADDLRSSTALRNLRRMDLNLGWNVGLTDSDLLALASAWPHLEHLLINEEWGWQTSGGITPDGLVHLLQTCRLLSRVTLAIDTRSYTEIPPTRSPQSLGLDLSPMFSLNVVDSVIDAESVPAMAAFLASILPSARPSLSAWRSWAFTWRSNKKVYAERWNNVFVRVGEAVAQRSVVSG